MRRTRLREALAELEAIGWKVEEYARAKYQVARPSA
jgi:hypothetical protein